ncbi:MAG: RNA polymerase III C11 subunit [Chaenotheca gracillima]|nr:MAG: RNA polymerase III C11 subunit [Chaenotheca gracillima]
MEGYESITMGTYLASPLSFSHLGASTDGMMPPMPADSMPDQGSNFDAETFVGSEDAFAPSAYQQETMRRFSSSYEDPFSDHLPFLEPHAPEPNAAESPAVEGDDKLLSFSAPKYNYNLLDFSGRTVFLSMSAQLHGMFFLAESPWAAPGEASAPPTELTCYRRNLFQITGSMTMPRALNSILTDQGEQHPMVGLELAISATESVEGNSVKIISVPWKTPAANTAVPEDKTEKEPPPLPLDLTNVPEQDSNFATFPIAWKRLQFRIATANNGRRKELQQHFVVRLRLMATLSSGGKVPICETNSGAIIVRGRSPRNFQTRKDLPLGGGTSSSRRGTNQSSTQPQRTPTTAGSNSQPSGDPLKSPSGPPAPPRFKYERGDLQLPSGLLEWSHSTVQQTGPLTALPTGSFNAASSFPKTSPAQYAQSTPDFSRHSPQQLHNGRPAAPPSQAPSAPISLSLTDDDVSPLDARRNTAGGSISSSGGRSSETTTAKNSKLPRLTHVSPRESITSKFISSPDESADLLYEYFPLGLDDWMPPVDAVYRPHVVHHTNLPPDPKAQAAKNRSKRYFSEDQAG